MPQQGSIIESPFLIEMACWHRQRVARNRSGGVSAQKRVLIGPNLARLETLDESPRRELS